MHHQDYTVAIICALPVELAAARAMLTEIHDDLEQRPNDLNAYSLGRMGHHNVVIACLPYGQYGVVSAANVANQLLRTFTNIKIGLMVGIAGGIPSSKHDVRLGDIVVSKPTDQHGGVIQYDLAKVIPQKSPTGEMLAEPDFQIVGHLNRPSEITLTALTKLRSAHDLEGPQLSRYLSEAYDKYPKFKEKYNYPGAEYDWLYQSHFEHVEEDHQGEYSDSLYDDQHLVFCKNCDAAFLRARSVRKHNSPTIHYGLIASGNQLMRHGRTRDRIGQEVGAMCFEMEAAGLMTQNFLVVRGICDYADSHKNKIWQPYASAVAAAYARELIEMLPPNMTIQKHLRQDSTAESDRRKDSQRKKQGTLEVSSKIAQGHRTAQFSSGSEGLHNEIPFTHEDIKECQNSLYFQELTFRHVGIKTAALETCQWVLHHPVFKHWISEHQPLLWIKGKPGTGKSTLMKHIHQHLIAQPESVHPNSVILSYFFHGRGNMLQKTRLGFIRSILYQALDICPSAFPSLVRTFMIRRETIGKAGENWNWTLDELMDFFKVFIRNILENRSVLILVDALDECGEEEAALLVENFHYFLCDTPNTRSNFKICFSCRYYPVVDTFPGLSIAVQTGNSKDIETYAKHRLSLINLRKKHSDILLKLITDKAKGIFQWVSLIIQRIEKLNRVGTAFKFLEAEIKHTPLDLDELYSGLLQDIEEENKPKALKLMQWICFSFRLLRVDELRLAMIIDEDSTYSSFQDFLDDDQIGDMSQRITALSCGILEVQEHENKQFVQFIHQSAEDFFQRKGFRILNCTEKDSITFMGISHRRIAGSCIRYFSLFDHKTRHAFNVPPGTDLNQEGSKERSIHETKPSQDPFVASVNNFLKYAIEEWPRHSSWVNQLKCPNAILLNHFQWPHSDVVELWTTLKTLFKLWYPSWRSPSFLHLTARYSLLDPLQATLERLKQVKETADPKDAHGRTPFSYAAEEGHVAAAKLLLKHGGIDLDSKDSKKRTPLWWATFRGREEMIKLILEQDGVDINVNCSSIGPPLRTSIFQRNKGIVELLLRFGADINIENRYAQTPLFLAAKGGPPEVVELLIQKGANVHHVDVNKRTPIFYAVESRWLLGPWALVELLLDAGVDINHKDIHGRTALFSAVMSLNAGTDFADLLIAHGCNVWEQDYSGKTALSWAAALGFIKMIKYLISKGLDVNHQDADKQTPLFLAASRGQRAAVELLVKNPSVDVSRPDKSGKSPLQAARELDSSAYYHRHVVELLESVTIEKAGETKE